MNPIAQRLAGARTRIRTWRSERPKTFYALAALLTLSLTGVVAVVALLLAVNYGAFGHMPSKQELLDYRNDIGSEAFDVNGVSLGRYYKQDREETDYDDLPEHLVQALIATEDSRFYTHSGIDWEAYGRVLYKTILQGEGDQGGGSTLSQQLIKNAYGRPDLGYDSRIDLLLHKLREGILARRLEAVMPKEEVMERYLNTVSFPGNTFGIAAASRRYFQREPEELTVRQAASLVASLKGTSSYDPRRAPERNARRTDLVLGLMGRAGYLTAEEVAEARADDLCMVYYREPARAIQAPHFAQEMKKQTARLLEGQQHREGRPYNLYTDNLRIYTTLDLRYQAHAERAVERQMKILQRDFERHLRGRDPWETDASLRGAVRNSDRWRSGRAAGLDSLALEESFRTKISMELPVPNGEPLVGEYSPLDSVKHSLSFLRAGFLVLDHADAAVRAWVGGADFKFSHYDHVTSRRQTGSTFKAFVYAAALREGYDPCHRLSNALRTYPDEDGPWTPHNSDWVHGGTYSMHGALTHSSNVAAVKMIMETTPEPVVNIARAMGIRGEIRPIPSIALGTVESSLYEMVGAYATFPNGGEHAEPYFITRIENGDGEVIYEHEVTARRVMDEVQAATMVQLLRNVVERGTASRLRWEYGVLRPSIGKTGTTQNMADGWFVGSTPALTGGAWVGGENTGVRYRSGEMGNGARSALPIWAYFLQNMESDTALVAQLGEEFPEVPDDVRRSFRCAEFVPPVQVVEEVPADETPVQILPVSDVATEPEGR
ncbi:transglycosylase domain-containing protein [Lewinella sp. JB7]|uniref:transglycosylase domain-containing protein n=1 Tax=Lewinella sp. JB7 TaxID=2962887 RepID=UPI0020CA1566|nr:transglycosylase domain-containing protein [Lewinella sp. JB7]MCP9234880.1 transglycosylase domain-containing protein [Lewinella sp. JB7]